MSVKKSIIFIILILLIVIICLSACKPTYEYGNLTGNRQTASQNGWIFYSSGLEYKLYKMRVDGSEKTKLSDDSSSEINVLGNWIYYVSHWEDCKLPNGMTDELCKIKIDGTNRQVLTYGMNIAPVKVMNNKIYFSDFTEGPRYLYNIDIDGKNKTRIGKDAVWNFDVSKDWIYYTDINHNIKKIKVDGTNIQDLNTTNSGDLNVVGDWIFYIGDFDSLELINNSYESTSNLYKIKIDGTKRVLLRKNVGDLNSVGEHIYFHDSINGRFYSIESTGTNIKFINNDALMFYDVLGKWIYFRYYHSENDFELHRIRLDGTENQVLK